MPHSLSTSSTTESQSQQSPSPIIAKRRRTIRRLHLQDDEDLANCLMLLSKGGPPKKPSPTITDFYECKTCNKCFPSFQALGGHRASHKKPKISDGETSSVSTLKIASLIEGAKQRTHECSKCGSEFPSGQALGGHMRRHRNLDGGDETKEKKTVLMIDLNLPAPGEDDLFVAGKPIALAAAVFT